MNACRDRKELPVGEGFIEYSGSMKELQHEPDFRRLLSEHAYATVKDQVVNCAPRRGGKIECKRGFFITVLG